MQVLKQDPLSQSRRQQVEALPPKVNPCPKRVSHAGSEADVLPRRLQISKEVFQPEVSETRIRTTWPVKKRKNEA
ncbi:hypothetical protein CEXT_778131 [Caerostris extrusa]|uniref:Uncharacterized protein n=1 Tax=Caerostris extrusa TaxID=172846 RepID=A0AAV4RBV5_CAEEX|nr:hypothetical protein CEXT_778131 [Caerostris extrusa]